MNAAEIWTQLTLEVDAHPDDALLLDVAGWVDEVRDGLSAWHFFWEPDLWVRLRWRSEAARDAGMATLAERVAARGGRVDPYAWETDAAMMGREMWGPCQRDWMNGAELSVAHARARRDGRATKPIDFHWVRHVHLFSGQLTGTWAEEARLSLRQARYRLWLLSRTRGNEAERPRLEAMIEQLDAMLEDAPRFEACETRFLDAWRADGRPPIVERLDLPEDFSAQRRGSGVAD